MLTFLRSFLYAAALTVSLFATVWAEQTDPYPTVEMEPVYVTATGFENEIRAIPAAISVVDQLLIQAGSQQLSLNESLQTVPGVFALNPYNFAQDSRIAIRGFGARSNFGIRGIRMIVDDIPSTLPDGQGGVDGIDLGSARRIEVIRGPSAAIYGPASGGAIRIITENASADSFIESRFTSGSFGLRKAQFKAGLSGESLNVLVNATHLDYDGYRENSGAENRSINAKLVYVFEDQAELTTVLQAIDFPVQDDPGGLNAAEIETDRRQARDRNLLFDGGESVQQEKLGLAYRKPLGDARELRLNAFVVQRDFANKLPFRNGGQVAFDRVYWGVGGRYTYSDESYRLMIGAEVGDQEDDRLRFDNLNGDQGPVALDQSENVLNLGSFISGELFLGDQLAVSGALRYDEVEFDVVDRLIGDGNDSGSLTFREMSPSVGVSWAVSRQVSLYSNLATSFETPTTTELDNPSGGGFNEDLVAQTARSLEVGAKGALIDLPGRPKFEIALFTIDVDDALVPFELEAFPDREFFRNAGSTRKDGFEAAVELELVDRLMATLSYTYSDFRYDDFVSPSGDFGGNQLPGLPQHFGNVRLDYRTENGFSFVWNTRFVGALHADDANASQIDSYSVTDLRVRWEKRFRNFEAEFFVGLNNAFDEDYSANIRINAFGGRYFEPAPERNTYGGVRVRYLFF